MALLKIISLNIEGDNHLHRIIPFFKKENADVLCLQEVLEKDIPFIKSELNMDGLYKPLMYIRHPNPARLSVGTNWGILTLTKEKSEMNGENYVKQGSDIPFNDPYEPNSCDRAIITAKIIKDSIQYTVINTHFTWSVQGESTQLQLEHLETMFKLLDPKKEFILCGDFNAPRGKPTWQRLSEKYTDNVPAHEITSIDPDLHRVKTIKFFVDGIFTTQKYKAHVQVCSGVSDHKALIGIITRAP